MKETFRGFEITKFHVQAIFKKIILVDFIVMNWPKFPTKLSSSRLEQGKNTMKVKLNTLNKIQQQILFCLFEPAKKTAWCKSTVILTAHI